MRYLLSQRGHDAVSFCPRTSFILAPQDGRPVKGNPVDHRSDHNTALHELADGLANVLIVPAETINPADDQRVARPQQVEEAPSLDPLR